MKMKLEIHELDVHVPSLVIRSLQYHAGLEGHVFQISPLLMTIKMIIILMML